MKSYELKWSGLLPSVAIERNELSPPDHFITSSVKVYSTLVDTNVRIAIGLITDLTV
jgi:hypothetical protein